MALQDTWRTSSLAVAAAVLIASPDHTAAQVLDPAPPVASQTSDAFSAGFAAYKTSLVQRAAQAGIIDAALLAAIPQLPLNMRAIELDRAQRPSPGISLRSPPMQPHLR